MGKKLWRGGGFYSFQERFEFVYSLCPIASFASQLTNFLFVEAWNSRKGCLRRFNEGLIVSGLINGERDV